VLRREAEAMIFPNTAAFSEGKHQPRDNTERLALLGVCRFKNRTRASARLYADARSCSPAMPAAGRWDCLSREPWPAPWLPRWP
jgi:serine/threonine-protein kinase